jgi:glycosyltransferase involved in cell wall biosynthesis
MARLLPSAGYGRPPRFAGPFEGALLDAGDGSIGQSSGDRPRAVPPEAGSGSEPPGRIPVTGAEEGAGGGRQHFTVVALPAYNAEGTLERTVGALPAGSADHLLLVDDASPDRTVELARGLGIDVRVHDVNRGYGANQKTCYREALDLGATVIVLLHPDYQYDPGAVPALIAPIVAGVADFTFGSRFACTGDPRSGGMPLYRYWGNRFSTVVENVLLRTHFTEMHSGMKAYSRRFLESVPFDSYSDDFVFDTEILVAAVVGGFRIQEVAIPTRYTRESSSINVRRSLEYIGRSIEVCWRASGERRAAGRRLPR